MRIFCSPIFLYKIHKIYRVPVRLRRPGACYNTPYRPGCALDLLCGSLYADVPPGRRAH